MVASNCQTTVKSIQTLNEVERNSINGEKSRFGRQPWGTQPPNKHFSTKYSSGTIVSQAAINMNNRNYHSISGALISKNDEDNFSIAKPGLPMNVAHVFFNKNVVTFVYYGGQVQMKPTNCLQTAEQQLVEQSKLEVKQTEKTYYRQLWDSFQLISSARNT